MKHLDLFSGIGGFALAAGEVWGDEHEIVGFCDNDSFCSNVLKKHWPDTPIYGDIRELTAARLAADAEGISKKRRSMEQKKRTVSSRDHIDLLTGGFPCQPFSNAGKKRGDKDDRFLWPEMLRVIRETKPAWVVGENVAGIINMALDQVCSDLEGEGYAVQPFVIPACAVGAPHRRDRVWIVGRRISGDSAGDGRNGSEDPEGDLVGGDRNGAREDEHRKSQGADCLREGTSENARNADLAGLEGHGRHDERAGERLARKADWENDWRTVARETCWQDAPRAGDDRVDDGLPKRMVVLPDGSRISQARWRREALKAYGNAIVPQVAVEIMKAIKATGL